MAQPTYTDIAREGLWRNNPALVQILGLCPLLAVTNTVIKLRKALGDLTFMSFYGSWDVDETGKQIGHPMVDVQWQNGKRLIVAPAAAKTGDIQYPMPTFAEKTVKE